MKKLFIIFILLTSAAMAAPPFNNSHVSPKAARDLSVCPTITEERQHCEHWDYKCNVNGDSHLIERKYQKIEYRPQDYFITHMCYRPTCYYQAVQYVDENYPVQPLNDDTSIILKVINNQITPLKLANSKMNVFGSKGRDLPVIVPHQDLSRSPAIIVQDGLNFTPVPSGTELSAPPPPNNSHFQTSPPRYSVPLLPNAGFMAPPPWDMKNIEPGAGTSAFQGLLWSWRMVSNNWRTHWGVQSNYEAAGDASITKRATDLPDSLPNPRFLKNIIVISDGADTDGVGPVDNKGNVASVSPNDQDDRVSSESGFGQGLPASSTTLKRETCDAHAPNAAITDQDYQDLCDKIYEQGIRVHVVYFGYSGGANDGRLAYCAARTRGLLFDNQTDLVDAFRKIFASIAAQNVRLVQ